jgi:hypothetical protein
MKRLLTLLSIAIIATILLVCGHLPKYPCGQSIIRNILQGAYASTLVVLMFEFIQEYRLYKRLNILEGNWEEFGIKDRFLDGPIAKGKITYNGGNSLTIELSHHNRKWSGEIIVNKDYPHIGTISWAYVPDFGQDHEFGLKDIIIPTERNKVDGKYLFLYLLPVNHSMDLGGELRDNKEIVLSTSSYGKVVWRKEKRSR